MDVIKWQMNFGSCNFGPKSYLWFQIKLDFEITRMISDQIALHSVQLPLYISMKRNEIIYLITVGNISCLIRDTYMYSDK